MIGARGTTILCIGLLIAQEPYAIAQQTQPTETPPPQPETLLSPGELDSLVAPVALYPDPILSQVLVASTYPLEIVEAARWLKANSNISGKVLVNAAADQPWDASVQALVVLPEVLNRLDEEVRWTTELGNAFLDQEKGVMDAIQRMRQRASASGALHSTPEQTVSTTTENNRTYIVIEPASPEVVYVPVYDPVAVWGVPAVYAFPALSYPRHTGVATASAISFGMGMAVGSVWGGGWRGWGWNPGWGRSNVVVNNNFIRSNRFNRANLGPGNNWVRNPGRRAGGRYNNRNAASRVNNRRGNNASSRPTAERTRERLNQAGLRRGGTGASSRANLAERRSRRAGQGSAARRTGGASGQGQRARRGNAGQGSANRIRQRNGTQGRQNRAGNARVNRGSANRRASGGRNRGGAGTRSGANRNRGSANRSSRGSRGGSGGARRGGRRR
jgi:hypothetical protein